MKLNLNSLLLVAFLVFIVACNQKSKELKFSDFKISNVKYPIEGDSTSKFTYEACVPVFKEGSQQLIDSINTFVSQTFFEHKINTTDLKQLIKAESDSFYQDYLRDFSGFNEVNFPLTYNYIYNFNVAFNNTKYVTLKNENYAYTGGAHGNYSTLYYVFSVESGKLLSVSDLVTDTLKLQEIVKQQFYKLKNIDVNKPINDQGYWFEKNEFRLNSNFGLLSDTLIFTYNPYEITGFSEGQTELKIPLSLFK